MAANTAKKSLSLGDTFSRLLRLRLPSGPVVTGMQLMDASETRLSQLARSSSASPEQIVAKRILDNPTDFRRWESEHARYMDGIAREPRQPLQIRALLTLSFALTHRQALFEFLRDRHLRGPQRRQVVAHFHGGAGYAQAMVAEHNNYLRSSASLICSAYIGSTTFAHSAFGEPLRAYGQMHMEYFRTYCEGLIAPADGPDSDAIQSLLPHLKRDVLEMRTRLLAMPAQSDRNRPLRH